MMSLSQERKSMHGMLFLYMTSRLGCAGEPDKTEFPLKYMGMLVAFDRSSFHVAEFSNHLHADVKFRNRPMH